MTNDLVNWQEQLAKDAQAVARTMAPEWSMISFRGGLYYQKTLIPEGKIPAVIIDQIYERQWYSGDFDDSNLQNPTCYSRSIKKIEDGDPNLQPSEAALAKQGKRCIVCPWDAWKSASTPSRPTNGKACKVKIKVGVVPVSAITDPTVTEAAGFYLPVTSVRIYENYVQELRFAGLPPWAVITEVHRVPHPKFNFEVKFRRLGDVDQEAGMRFKERIPAIRTRLMEAYNYTKAPEDAAPVETAKKRKF